MSTSGEAVIVWGEVLWDRFPDGDQLGGAPANVAWHLGQAGGWAQLVTRVGDDEALAGALAALLDAPPPRARLVEAARPYTDEGSARAYLAALGFREFQ